MAEGKFVSYLRVSTDKQAKSGLGLEAQRKAVEDYLNGGKWKLVKELVEVESGKREDNRPMLAQAMAACRLHKARISCLVSIRRASNSSQPIIPMQMS